MSDPIATPAPITTALSLSPDADLLWSTAGFEHAQRVAKMFASSELVPPHLRGPGKVADVTIALVMARRMQEDPLVVMQSIYVVAGRAGWSAQYVIARANKSGVFSRRINWRTSGSGDALAIAAFATLAESGDEVSFTASMAMAQAEGWVKNPKYRSMPELMLRYRSAVLLVRLYAPEVMLGYSTVDEIVDVRHAHGEVIDLEPMTAQPATWSAEVEREAAQQATGNGKPTGAAALNLGKPPPVAAPASSQSSSAPAAAPAPEPPAVEPAASPQSDGPDPAALKRRARELESRFSDEQIRQHRAACGIDYQGDIRSSRLRAEAMADYVAYLESVQPESSQSSPVPPASDDLP